MQMQCPSTPGNATEEVLATSPLDVELAGTTSKSAGEGGPKRFGLLPWQEFLPTSRKVTNRSETLGPEGGNFDELLDKDKKRLGNAEMEGNMRERAEVVGKMGSRALHNLLADLREPSFSRQQNE